MRVLECGSTARETDVPDDSGREPIVDFDYLVDFFDPRFAMEMHDFCYYATHKTDVVTRRVFLPATLKSETDLGSSAIGRCLHHKKLVWRIGKGRPCYDLEINCVVWGRETYNDLFEQQMKRLGHFHGDFSVKCLKADIRRLKQEVRQIGFYKRSESDKGVRGVGLEQLVIQSGDIGKEPHAIKGLGSLKKAIDWILSATKQAAIVSPGDLCQPYLQVKRLWGLANEEKGTYFDSLTNLQWERLVEMVSRMCV
jgi:CO dehydrogenase/acetyl-CoA synthase epsilon subunit